MSKSGSLGALAIIDTNQPLGIFESLAVLKYDRSRLNGIFLMEQLRSRDVQQQLLSDVKGVAVKHLHLNVISKIGIIVPSMDKQLVFENFVKQIYKSKSALQNTITSLQTTKRCILEGALGTRRKE